MKPIQLICYLGSKFDFTIRIIISAIFVILAMITGILIVVLTSPKPSRAECALSLTKIVSKGWNLDSYPQSVALNDLDKDGHLDVIVANTNSDEIGIFFGHGDGNFSNQIIYLTGNNSLPYSVAVADFDNDNCTDIAVANYGSHTIGIFLGYCNRSIANQITYPTNASRPFYIATGHLNDDHWLDIVVVNYGTDNIGILFGYGNGSFSLPILHSTGYDSFPHHVVISDLNDDSNQDIIVANYGTDNIGILYGYGNGTFASQKIYSTGHGSKPYSIALGYFNDDEILDIAVAKFGLNQIGIFLGYENSSYAHEKIYSTGTYTPFYIGIGDFVNNYVQDIIVVYSLNDSIGVFLGIGDGTFVNMKEYSTGIQSHPYSIALGELNHDDRMDIVIVNSVSNNIGVFLGDNPVAFENPQIYFTGNFSYPKFVIVADLNNDSNSDIVVANMNGNSIDIFLGFGNGNFTHPNRYKTIENFKPILIVIGDFNNDDRIDIAVASYDGKNLGIYLGYGNGTFTEQIVHMINFGDSLSSMTVGDFNNDNRLDIVVANFHRGNDIGVFLGYGNGTFSDKPVYSTIDSGSSSIAVADFNNDSYLDIAVAYYQENIIGILLGYGNGNFQKQINYTTNGWGLNAIAVDDLNKDKKPDIVVAHRNTYDIHVLLGYGNGSFAREKSYSLNSAYYPISIVIADMNNDKQLDIVVASEGTSNIDIFQGLGNGTFLQPTIYSTGSSSTLTSITFGNFTGGERMDIVVTNGQSDSISILLAYDPDAFLKQTIYNTGSASHPNSIVVGDFNHDDRLDILVAKYGDDRIGVFLGYGNHTFANEIVCPTGPDSLPISVAIGDFNRDTHLDFVTANIGIATIDIFLGYGNGSFINSFTYSIDPESQLSSIITGDFNNDNWTDIVVTDEGTDSISIFLGYKYAQFLQQMTFSTGIDSDPIAIAIDDFNNDKVLDMIVINAAAHSINIFLGNNNGSFIFERTYLLANDAYSTSIATADLNFDNCLDFIVTNAITQTIDIFLGFGNGTFQDRITYSTGTDSTPTSIIIVDFNNDHKLDIAVANSGSNTIGIFLAYGNGSFQNQKTYSTGSNSEPLSIAVGDFNLDKQVDIVVANRFTNEIGIFFGFGDGTFADQITYSTGKDSNPRSVVVADFNNDDQLDIAVINYLSNNIGIFLGYNNGTFANQMTFSTGSYSRPISANVRDFNNDNILDIVVVNTNTSNFIMFLGYGDGTFGNEIIQSLGVKADPSYVAVDDFNNDKQLDIAIVNRQKKSIVIFLGYCCEPFQRQMILSTNLNSRPHSIAIGDFNIDNKPDIVVAYQGTNSLGFLFGHGDGTFTNQMNLSTGFNSQPFSVAVGDFNRDNRPDVTVANHKNETISVFLGYGNGEFKFDKTYWIGFGSQPCSVSIGDFDNDTQLDIVVTDDGTDIVNILFGYGNGSFGRLMKLETGYNSGPCAATVGDFNNDGISDMAIALVGSSAIGIISKFC